MLEKFDLFTGGIPKNLPIFKESSDEVKKRITLFRKVRNLFLSHLCLYIIIEGDITGQASISEWPSFPTR